ncbi:MAG: phosphomethylpyrimidine synthase ThiC, partial [Clostridia bacterium]
MSITERMKSPEMIAPVLERETITEEELLEGLEKGSIVIPANPRHKNLKPVAIGKGLSTKVSASIGMYCQNDTPEGEMEKLNAAVNAGTDALMDLSVRGDIKGFRKQVIEIATVPVGTLPLYEALSYAEAKRGSALKMEADDLFEVIEEQAKDGVDFMAFHPAITLKMIEHIKESGRIDPMVSF